MKKLLRLHETYVFLAIIGGVRYFGLAAILYGPLILGFARVMLYIYRLEYQDLLGRKEEIPALQGTKEYGCPRSPSQK